MDEAVTMKVLLVEDEPMLLQGLTKIVDWSALGFEICAAADNYESAAAAASLHRPDLIITDIMLGENQKTGLDLVREFGGLIPEMQAVLLTGYDVFAYAEKAIEYNVKSYLLKPVGAAQLEECLMKLKRNFLARRQEMLYRQELDSQLKTAVPFLFEWFLTSARDTRWQRFFGLTGSEEDWQMIVICFSKEADGKYLYDLFLRMEYLKENYQKNAISFFQRDHFIYALRSEAAAPALDTDALTKLFQNYCDFNGFPNYVIGIGRAVKEFSRIRDSYREAYSACRYIEFFDWGKCVYYSDVAISGEPMNISFSPEKERLQFSVRMGHTGVTEQIMKDILLKAADQGASVDTLRSLGLEALVILNEVARESGIPEISGSAWKKVELCSSLADLLQMLISSYETVCASIEALRIDRNRATVKKVKQMIDTEYGKNITLENLSKLVYLSPNYLSKLFYGEYGISFKDYLIQVRMEAAKTLLRDDRMKVYEIGERVGYTDSRYFSQVFKKYTNMTPLGFRSRIIEDGEPYDG
ncbi:MAG: two component transcriptional regulator, AraC family [Bacillota bacterium]|jgi:two-component system response regulator YesN|nr:two component transcriptional regulator, AraC family [Bacillota bacterium]